MIKYMILNNIELNGFVGCLPEERKQKSKISLTLKLTLNLPELLGEENDRLENTIDYREIIKTAEKTLDLRHYSIIENLGEHIAENILNLNNKIQKVELSISKPEVFNNSTIPEVVIFKGK